jgi:hypothetical protein
MPLSSLATSLISNIVSSILGAAIDGLPSDDHVLSGYSPESIASPSRMFPAGTAVGLLAGAPENGIVLIDGHPLRAAPGLQVRDEGNRIVLPVMLNRQHMPVRYKLDPMGNVWRVWLLTPAEIAQSDFPNRASTLPFNLAPFVR